MLQVDPFTTFSLGAMFAITASKQLKQEEKPFQSKYFLIFIMFLSFFFVPAVSYLLIQYPGWETMFVLHPYIMDLDSVFKSSQKMMIPSSAGLILSGLIVSSMVTGSLGFCVATRFIQRDNLAVANLLWITGLTITVLICAVSYERTFYAGTWFEWHQWKVLGMENNYTIGDFFSSKLLVRLVFIFSYVLAPAFIIWAKWFKEGKEI